MTEKPAICVVVCENHARDLRTILAGTGFEGVHHRILPARCLPGEVVDATCSDLLDRLCGEFSYVDVLGGPCLRRLGPPAERSPGCRFHLLAPMCLPAVDERMAVDLVSDGAYLLTSGWLESWRLRLSEMGLDRETARALFGETCKVLTLLDTGDQADSGAELAELGEWLGLPVRRIAIGLERFRLLLSRIVMQRRIDQLERDGDAERERSNRKTAEYETVLDILSRLTKFTRKEDVIQTLFDLFVSVLGASRCAFATVTDGRAEVVASLPAGGQIDPAAVAALLRSRRGHWLDDRGDGFLLLMDEIGGDRFVIDVGGLAVPAYRERYLDLAVPATRVVSLAFAMARAVEESAFLLESAAQDQRLKATGTLASGVAHEINNPLAVVLSYAELLGDELASQEGASKYLAEIVSHARRIGAIVKRLAEFAASGSGTPSWMTAGALLDDALGLLGSSLESEGIVVTTDVAEDLPTIHCDPQAIQQVLLSLLANARDALNERYPGTDEDKALTVRAMLVADSKPRMVRLTVENHGAEISDEVRSHMFEPFFTTRSRASRAGLGLFVSHGIVAHHGGRLSLEIEPGRFTRFHVDLPAVEVDQLPKSAFSGRTNNEQAQAVALNPAGARLDRK